MICRLHNEHQTWLRKEGERLDDRVVMFVFNFMELMDDDKIFKNGIRKGTFCSPSSSFLGGSPNNGRLLENPSTPN
jgi:hypothetical protein